MSNRCEEDTRSLSEESIWRIEWVLVGVFHKAGMIKLVRVGVFHRLHSLTAHLG